MNKCVYCGCELTTGDYGEVCSQCRNAGLEKMFDPPSIPSPYYGPWICPRCGTVHAPWISRCDCPPPSITTTGTRIGL